MNIDRRKTIQKVIDQLEFLSGDISTIREDEQDYLDNMPDNLRQSENADRAEEAINALDEAESQVESAIEYLTIAMEQ